MEKRNQLRVLYLIHAGVPYGANVALINLLDQLLLKGVMLFVVYAEEGDFVKWLVERKVPHQKIFYRFQIYPSNITQKEKLLFIPKIGGMVLMNQIAEFGLKRVVKKFNPDIIHTNIGPAHIGFEVARKCNIPHVWHIREYQDLDFNMCPFPSMRQFRQKLTKSHVIAITEGIRRHFCLNENSKVIYDGVLPCNFVRFDKKKDPYFLFVGRLEKTKGIEDLIRAFIKFASINTDYQLLVAGEGEYSYVQALKENVNRHCLSSRIKFLGFRSDRLELMSKATALIVPSRHEGFGFITVEAMFSGCLVVGNNIAGTKEILEKKDGSFGILYEDEYQLVDSLKQIVNEGIESYFDIITKAQLEAVNQYSAELHAQRVFEFYKDMLI